MQIPQFAGLLLNTGFLIQYRKTVMDRNSHFQHLVNIALRQGIVGRQIEEDFIYPFMADPGKNILSASIDRNPVYFRHFCRTASQQLYARNEEITEGTLLQFLDYMPGFGSDRDDEERSFSCIPVTLPSDPDLVQAPDNVGTDYEEDRGHDKEAP